MRDCRFDFLNEVSAKTSVARLVIKHRFAVLQARVRMEPMSYLRRRLRTCFATSSPSIVSTFPESTSFLRRFTSSIHCLEWKCHGGRKSGLAPHAVIIEAEFRRDPPHSTGEAIRRIEAITGILRTPTSVKLFLAKIGMRFRKVGSAPKGSENPVKQDEQEAFCKKNSTLCSKRLGRDGVWCFS